MQLVQTASNYKNDLLNSKCLMSVSDFTSNCFYLGLPAGKMPYLATPEALESSTHSSSTNTHSRARMNTPAPTPSTVPAILGKKVVSAPTGLGPTVPKPGPETESLYPERREVFSSQQCPILEAL